MKTPRPLPSVVAAAIVSLLLSNPTASHACGDSEVSITNVPSLPDKLLQVSAMSAQGHLTGFAYSFDFQPSHAFLYANGATIDIGPVGGSASQATAVNSAGVVVGTAQFAGSFFTHAFLYAGSTLQDLGTLGGNQSWATAVNELGQVAGYAQTPDDATMEGFLYTNGVMVSLGTLGGDNSYAYAINEAGQVAGISETAEFENHVFLYTAGNMLDLGSLGGDYVAVSDLNDSGVVVGESSTSDFDIHGFVFLEGTMHDIGTLGGTFSSVSAVNTAGDAVGRASTTDDLETHAAKFSGGQLTDLGTLGGGWSSAKGINDNGVVVGDSLTASFSAHAFLWASGAMLDLNDLLPANSGWELQSAAFVNNSGQIVGTGIHNDVPEWYILKLGGGSNHAPVAMAGADQTVECGSQFILDGSGSSDADQDPLSYEWSANGFVLGTNSTLTASFGSGTYTINLKVTDACGSSSQDDVSVYVTDTLPPVVSCPGALTASVGPDCQAVIPNLIPQILSSDNCTASGSLTISQSPLAGTAVGPGEHTILVTAVDASGNSASCSTTYTVADTTAPGITALSATPSILSPPNNQLVPVTVSVAATDSCDPSPVSQIISITADGATAPGEIQITGALTANLAASKNPSGAERTYTITVRCADVSGNSSTATVNVIVPKSNGNSSGIKNKP